MHVDVPHDWPGTPDEAIRIQDRLRPLADRVGPAPSAPRTVAGVDVAYAGSHGAVDDVLAAAVVVLDAATLEPVDEATAVGRAAFPYVPGLFAFRELPTLVEALRQLTVVPDVLLCDGQGYAHPRRFGLACHLGVITNLPTAGVAKTPLVGSFDLAGLGYERGAWTPLRDQGETVGRVLRTQDGIKPVYVSTGHRINLEAACRITLAASPRYRLPETTRLADRASRDALRAAVGR